MSCTATSSVNVIVNPPTSIVYSETPADCFGACTGSVTVTPSGTAPFNYAWSGGLGSNAIASNVCAGIYTVTVTDGSGCETTANVTVTEPTAVVVSLIVDTDESCAGLCDGQVSSTAAGGTGVGYTYSWSNGGTSSTEAGLCAGPIDVTVTDSDGCFASATGTINGGASVSAALNPVAAQCLVGNNFLFDGSASTSSVGSPTYNWDFGDGNTLNGGGNTTAYTFGGAGNYIVTVSVTDGICSDAASQNVTVNSTPQITSSISATPSCNGDSDGAISIVVGSGLPSYLFNWSSGQTSQNINTLSAGSYQVTVTDVNNCDVSGSFVLADPPPISIIQACNNTSGTGQSDGTSSVTVTGGSGGYTYAWNTGNTNSTATGLASGVQVVTVTDSNGCLSSSSCSVADGVVPLAVSQSALAVSCAGGSDGAVDIAVSGE